MLLKILQLKTVIVISGLLFLMVTDCFSQQVRKISKDELSVLLKNRTDKLYVLNFWASWCSPCVSEPPDFQKVMDETDSSRVDFLFISLDFPSDADKKLLPFLKENGYRFNTMLMTDLDYNSWIEMVDPVWKGNIPATLFFNNVRGVRYFNPGTTEKAELDHIIDSLLIN